MSKKKKIILAAVGAVILAVVLMGVAARQGQERSPRDDRQGREGRPGLQGHREREDPGAPEGGPLRPRHGPDRQPGGQGGGQGRQGRTCFSRSTGRSWPRRRRAAKPGWPPCARTSPASRVDCGTGQARLPAGPPELRGEDPLGGGVPEGAVRPSTRRKPTCRAPNSACARWGRTWPPAATPCRRRPSPRRSRAS